VNGTLSLSKAAGEDAQIDLSAYNVIAVIPAYNEGRFIGSMVLSTRQYCRTVIVVDDGSTDDTAHLAQLAGAQVICHQENRGKGAALNTALRAALAWHPDAVVTLDADGQHSPAEIERIAAPILKGQADIVIGSRYLNASTETPRHRIWGHWAFNLLTSAASGVTSSDSQSGFRAFSPRALEVISFQSSGFSVESEMQFLVKQHGLRTEEVPVTIKYPDRPKRSVIVHGVMVLNGILRLIGQYRPLLFFSVIGFTILLAGLIWGGVVVDIYRKKLELAVGYAMISVLLTILGSLLLAVGFILHSVRGLILELQDEIRRK